MGGAVRFLPLCPPHNDTAGRQPCAGWGRALSTQGSAALHPGRGPPACRAARSKRLPRELPSPGNLTAGVQRDQDRGPSQVTVTGRALNRGTAYRGVGRALWELQAGTREGRHCAGSDLRPRTGPTRRALRRRPQTSLLFSAPARVLLPGDPGLPATESPGPHPSPGSSGQERGAPQRGSRGQERGVPQRGLSGQEGSTPEGLKWTGEGSTPEGLEGTGEGSTPERKSTPRHILLAEQTACPGLLCQTLISCIKI